MTSPWDGDLSKLYVLDECSECGSNLRLIRGTEQIQPALICSSCGHYRDISPDPHSDEFFPINYAEEEMHPGDAKVGMYHSTTVREIVKLYEADWTRYEIADELEINVKSVIQAVKFYIRKAGEAYDHEKRNFAYHFFGEGTAEWRDGWDPEGAPAQSTIGLTYTDELDFLSDENNGEVVVRPTFQLLKHENTLQFSVTLRYEHTDPRKSEDIATLAEESVRLPNGTYNAVRDQLVESADNFAEYYEDNPET